MRTVRHRVCGTDVAIAFSFFAALAGIDPRKRLGGRQGGQQPEGWGTGTRLIEDEEDTYGRASGSSASRERVASRGRDGGKSKGSRSFSQQLRRGSASGVRAHDHDQALEGGSREVSFLPSVNAARAESDPDSRGKNRRGGDRQKSKMVAGESFGAGLSRGAGREQGVGVEGLEEDRRFGRKKRRLAGRSASRNVMLGR